MIPNLWSSRLDIFLSSGRRSVKRSASGPPVPWCQIDKHQKIACVFLIMFEDVGCSVKKNKKAWIFFRFVFFLPRTSMNLFLMVGSCWRFSAAKDADWGIKERAEDKNCQRRTLPERRQRGESRVDVGSAKFPSCFFVMRFMGFKISFFFFFFRGFLWIFCGVSFCMFLQSFFNRTFVPFSTRPGQAEEVWSGMLQGLWRFATEMMEKSTCLTWTNLPKKTQLLRWICFHQKYLSTRDFHMYHPCGIPNVTEWLQSKSNRYENTWLWTSEAAWVAVRATSWSEEIQLEFRRARHGLWS